MSRLLLSVATCLFVFSGMCSAAVVNFTSTSLTGAYGVNFGKITGGDPGNPPQQTHYFSGLASTSAASSPYQTQLKSTDSNPAFSGATQPNIGYGAGTVSASVAFKNNVGFQVAVLSTINTNEYTQLWTSGSFSFSVDTNTNYTFTGAAGNTDANLDLAQNYITLKNGASVMGTSGSLTAGTTYTVAFMSYASKTQAPTSVNQGGKTAYLETTLAFTGTTPPVVPEPASLAIFGTLGFAGFAVRRFRKK